jgi:hypothetical protein
MPLTFPRSHSIAFHRPTGLRKPSQDVAVALQKVDELSVDPGHCIQEVQRRMVGKK